jgi:cysteinyl-tRNA synthetase
VRKFNTYGKLSHQKLEDILVGARIEPGELKEDPLDFCLWKGSNEEPFWDSPFGKGRPGWHIECSAMAIHYLGETLDIHGGGQDLIFPHHENEIAQSEAYTGRQFSRYWLHHGLLTVNGEKMAKSLGNFITVKDILERYSVDVLKLFFLSSHYRSPIDFSFSKLEEEKRSLEKILIGLNKIDTMIKDQKIFPYQKEMEIKEIDEVKNKFLKAMDDDFNTPVGLACLFELVSMINKRIKDIDFVLQAKRLLLELADILGLTLKLEKPKISEEEIELWIKRRDLARKQRDFKLADRIRRDLETKGVILEDDKDKTVWRGKIK